MKAKRLLFLVMAICLASGVKAQFYDEADDIYYYVMEYSECEEQKAIYDRDPYLGITSPLPRYVKTGKIEKKYIENNKNVLIFNFDGVQAAELTNSWNGKSVSDIKQDLQKSSSYYEDKVETIDYDLQYSSSSYKDIVRGTKEEWKAHSTSSSWTIYKKGNSAIYIFSPDRNTLILHSVGNPYAIWYHKRVDKSYFKIGRSRTPSSTMHE